MYIHTVYITETVTLVRWKENETNKRRQNMSYFQHRQPWKFWTVRACLKLANSMRMRQVLVKKSN